MSYPRPATAYMGSTDCERFFNCTQSNRDNFTLFLHDVWKWITRQGDSWKDITRIPTVEEELNHEKQKEGNEQSKRSSIGSKLVSPFIWLSEYLSINRNSHFPVFFLLSLVISQLIPINSSIPLLPLSFWAEVRLLLMWYTIAAITWTLCFMLNSLHPHWGGPPSCVACTGFALILGWYWLRVLGGGFLFFTLLEVAAKYNPLTESLVICLPASLWLTQLYFLAILIITISNLPAYGAYPHLWGNPLQALPGISAILFTMFTVTYLPYLI